MTNLTLSGLAVNAEQLSAARELWSQLAKEHGWYADPFCVQVFVDDDGNVHDSVSWAGLDHDIAVAHDAGVDW